MCRRKRWADVYDLLASDGEQIKEKKNKNNCKEIETVAGVSGRDRKSVV